jgi:hypothetical protein
MIYGSQGKEGQKFLSEEIYYSLKALAWESLSVAYLLDRVARTCGFCFLLFPAYVEIPMLRKSLVDASLVDQVPDSPAQSQSRAPATRGIGFLPSAMDNANLPLLPAQIIPE